MRRKKKKKLQILIFQQKQERGKKKTKKKASFLLQYQEEPLRVSASTETRQPVTQTFHSFPHPDVICWRHLQNLLFGGLPVTAAPRPATPTTASLPRPTPARRMLAASPGGSSSPTERQAGGRNAQISSKTKPGFQEGFVFSPRCRRAKFPSKSNSATNKFSC